MHLWNRTEHMAYRAVVAIDDDRVTAFEARPGAQPNVTIDEYHEADVALRADPRVREVLAARGITDLDLVLIDTWAFGAHLLAEEHRTRRLGWADVWRRAEHGANPYANPVTGLHLIVDMDTLELVEIEDDGAIDEPEPMGEYVAKLVPGLTVRDDLRPYEVSQPQGASFTLDGNLLRWGRWSLRVGFNGREGLVLHTVGWDEGDRVRSVAHRLSFAEMVVPYRDPTTDHQRRTAFDVGEWGMGFMTTGLELGCDCLGEIAYLDATLHDSQGEPYDIPNAICIHEEDSGVLWKHVDEEAGAEVRRQRRLVVSFHATVANYEYLVYWRFYADGSIECEVRATGIMVTTHFAGEQPPYGTLVDERTYAPTHQHFIVARLDLDADGEENTVVASESEALPVGPDERARAGGRAALVAAADRVRGAPGLRLGDAAVVEGRQRALAQRARDPGGLQARAGRRDPADAGPVLTGAAARGRPRAHAVGDALRARGALALRRDGGAGDVRPRAPGLDGGGPPDPGHRRGPLVRLRHPPRDPPGGLAGDAGGHRVVLAEAGGLLRPQPGVGRGAASGASRALRVARRSVRLRRRRPCSNCASRGGWKGVVAPAVAGRERRGARLSTVVTNSRIP